MNISHRCWRVEDVDGLLSSMYNLAIKHTVVRRNGESNLFPSDSITFISIEGLGLIELLCGVSVDKNYAVKLDRSPMHLDIESSNAANSRAFLKLIGYHSFTIFQQDDSVESWTIPSIEHIIHLIPVNENAASKISSIGRRVYSRFAPSTCLDPCDTIQGKMSTTWWSRIKLQNQTE